jgi:coenzyme Q-binding protein COQ10
MPVFKSTRRVAVPPALAFDVAADVASYKTFLPLLERSSIRGAVTEASGVRRFKAELEAGYAKLGLREAFVSDVTADANARTVSAVSEDGPFRSMKTVWSIREANGQSDVAISIEYSMRNPLIQIVVSGAMDMAVAKVMAAFEARAKLLHTQSNTS